MILARTMVVSALFALSACGFGTPERPENKPAVFEHSHYRCSILWTRDQKQQEYLLYDLHCQAKKTGIIKNVVVYTRKFNRRSYRKTTLDRNEFLPARNLKRTTRLAA